MAQAVVGYPQVVKNVPQQVIVEQQEAPEGACGGCCTPKVTYIFSGVFAFLGLILGILSGVEGSKECCGRDMNWIEQAFHCPETSDLPKCSDVDAGAFLYLVLCISTVVISLILICSVFCCCNNKKQQPAQKQQFVMQQMAQPV